MSDMIHLEVHFYLSSLLWGMIIVALYDVLRIFRRIVRHGKFWVGVEDMLFWIISAILIFRMIFQYNSGIIRVPGIIIMMLGMVVYHYGISNPLIGFLTRRIIMPVKRGISILIKGLKNVGKKVRMSLMREKVAGGPHEQKKGKSGSH